MLKTTLTTLSALLISLSLGLVGCGGGKNPDLEAKDQTSDDQTVGTNKYEVVSGEETLEKDEDGLKGVGKILFLDALSKPESANNFVFDFQLEPEGSITFFSNAVNDLTRGINFVFARPAADKPLTAAVIAGEDNFDISEFVKDIDASKRIKFLIDVHNDHGATTHFLIWDGTKPVGDKPEDSALINDMLRDRGYGSRYGIEFNKAKLFDFKQGGPIDEH